MEAHATFTVERTGEGQRTHWHDASPIVIRPTAPDQVHLLHAAGGPLGGDRLHLTGTMGDECVLRVQSAAATVVQPDPQHQPALWTVHLTVGAGATLHWTPEPTVVCADADYHPSVQAVIEPTGTLLLRELVVLGRSGEPGGHYAGTLKIDVGDQPLLHQENLMDAADPVLSGPAGTAGHRVHGTLLVAGQGTAEVAEQAGKTKDVSWAVLPLDGPGWLALAIGPTVTEVQTVLDHISANWLAVPAR
jgi:urease accessory protein